MRNPNSTPTIPSPQSVTIKGKTFLYSYTSDVWVMRFNPSPLQVFKTLDEVKSFANQ